MSEGESKKKGRKKYIPGYALFKFEPDKSWPRNEAKEMYDQAKKEIDIKPFKINTTYFQDCILEMQKLPDESIDLIVADPPFGIDFSGKERIYNRKKDHVVDDYQEIDAEHYDQFSEAWIAELPRLMKPTSSAYIFSGWTNLESVLYAVRKAGLTVINHLIWQYQFGVFTHKKFVSSHYHLLFLVKNESKYFFNKIKHYPLDVWKINREYVPKEMKNGTKLPITVVEECLHYSSKPGDIILDPFMGNGTTGEAAKANYRHFIGFEKNIKLKPIIKENIKSIRLGRNYLAYSESAKKWLEENLSELEKKYPKAFKKWDKERNKKSNK